MINSMKYLIIIIVSVFLLSGCENQKSQSNAVIDENVNNVQLVQLLKQPSNYVEKELVVSGNYFSSCASSCCDTEFILKDGIHQIKVLGNKDMKLSELTVAQPIRLMGILKSTVESPYILASVIEVGK